MEKNANPLKILFVAGGLAKGGAEKQLIYMLRALRAMNAEIQVLSLSKGDFHEPVLKELGIPYTSLGDLNQAARLVHITRAARTFKPHFIQATHFYAGFYTGIAGKLTGIPSIGAVRNDLYHDMAGVGKIGRWLLRLPTVLLANSHNARQNALKLGIPENRIFVLQNVIDLNDFDRRLAASPPDLLLPDRIRVINVARLMPFKRQERLLHALAIACQEVPELQGVIVGGGSELNRLHETATSLGLQPDNPRGTVRFLGDRSEIPQLLGQSQIFTLTSDREGFPNVLLEAMAASLPVITTPAGEARTLVEDGINGYQVPFNSPEALASRLVELARSPSRRRLMGHAGRRLVENQFSYSHLAANLSALYSQIAAQVNHHLARSALNSNGAKAALHAKRADDRLPQKKVG